MGVSSDESPLDVFAYAERTAEASAASMNSSLFMSPSFIVMTEAELSVLAVSGAAVSLTLVNVSGTVCVQLAAEA